MAENETSGQTPEEQSAAVDVAEPAQEPAEAKQSPEESTAQDVHNMNPDDIEMPDPPRSEMEKEILAEMERQEAKEEQPEPAETAATEDTPPSEEDVLAELSALEQQEQSSEPQVIGDAVGNAPTVQPVQMGELKRTGPSGKPRNIDILMDVKLPVAIELGRTQLTVHDILELAPGSVVELNKLAGEPVDLLVNNKVVAKGEVVVVDENFGLRVSSLISPEERIKSL